MVCDLWTIFLSLFKSPVSPAYGCLMSDMDRTIHNITMETMDHEPSLRKVGYNIAHTVISADLTLYI